MNRREFVALLYQDPQPAKEIEELPPRIYACELKLPEYEGEFLVHHRVYGWCIYAYSLKHEWGMDDLVDMPGNRYNRVTHWADLDFLEIT